MYGHQPHPITPTIADSISKTAKPRGNYNCGRCGQPKKGHVCHVPSPASAVRSVNVSLRRALSFEDMDVDENEDVEIGSGKLPVRCLWEVMRRLPPPALLTAAKVCTGWRGVSKRIWKAAEELRLRVPVNTQVGYVGSVLQKCLSLVRLSLIMRSDMDSTMLACIAFACPNLESLEISMCEGSFNRTTGDELGRFIADKRCLTSLKIEGCSNLGSFVLTSNTLSTLWLSDLYSLSKMVFNLPNLNEISLDFSRQENDSTDLTSMMDGLGRSCPKLKNIHIASLHLSHSVVLSLTAAHLRGLRMLSLVLGSEITDASVVAISKIYSNLELLDLSGSSISDSGLGMICNVFPETLTRLLVALCPNITSSGIQFATAQLPLLELMDCGMTICESDAQYPAEEENSDSNLHVTYQKLFIKHARLKKLSLWGCTSLDSLYLSCPNLNDLNLNSCKNLVPEKLVLQCPKVESVHAIGCKDLLIQTIQTQVSSGYGLLEDHYSRKRMADGSKRVRIPFSFSQQLPDCDKNSWEVRKRRRCTVQAE
ncbi:F-box/LRR-repeat protein 17-like [Bidens hawaiensis]|uniref:F-box/LRR-repeat protein 17-like n=1 Tax=Bidens hawaiensis TaxID=980011 RepID=UPI00404A0266